MHNKGILELLYVQEHGKHLSATLKFESGTVSNPYELVPPQAYPMFLTTPFIHVA